MALHVRCRSSSRIADQRVFRVFGQTSLNTTVHGRRDMIETQETQDTVGTLETQEIFGTQETQVIFGTQDTQSQVAPGLTMMQRGGGRGDGEGEREGLHGVRSRHSDAGSRQSTDENESVGRTSGYKRRKIS